MRRRSILRAVLVLVASHAGFAACDDAEIRPDDAATPPPDDAATPTPDGASPDSGPTGGEPVPATELCSELAAIWCDARRVCCSDPGSETLMDCRDRTVVGCNEAVGRVLISRAVGYSPVIARGAVEQARQIAMECDTGIADFVGTREGVLRVLEGTTTAGRECAMAYDDLAGALSCADHNVCHIVTLLPLATRCSAPGRTGEPCRLDLECDTGFQCSGGGLTQGACAPTLADGQPCDRWQQCTSFVCEGRTCVERTQDNIYCAELFDDYLEPM